MAYRLIGCRRQGDRRRRRPGRVLSLHGRWQQTRALRPRRVESVRRVRCARRPNLRRRQRSRCQPALPAAARRARAATTAISTNTAAPARTRCKPGTASCPARCRWSAASAKRRPRSSPHGGWLWVTSWGDHRIERYRLVPRGASYGAEARSDRARRRRFPPDRHGRRAGRLALLWRLGAARLSGARQGPHLAARAAGR